MFMNCTYAVFMLRASLPEGTHGVTNVGGLTANQTLGVTHALMVLYPDSYVPVRVTHGAVVTHRYTYVPPRCRTSQYRMTFILLPVPLWNNLADPVFDGVGLTGFKSRSNTFYCPKLLYPYFSLPLFFTFSLLVFYFGDGVFGLIWCRSLYISALHCKPLLIIVIIIGTNFCCVHCIYFHIHFTLLIFCPRCIE